MTDDNVVTFGGNGASGGNGAKKCDHDLSQLVAICSECQCNTFKCFADGTVKCSYCETPLVPNHPNEENWERCIPEPPADPSIVKEAKSTTRSGVPDNTMSRRRTLKIINKWDGDIELVDGYHKDGTGRWWTNISTEEDREYVLRKVAEVIDWVVRIKIDGSNELVITGDNIEQEEQAAGDEAASEAEGRDG